MRFFYAGKEGRGNWVLQDSQEGGFHCAIPHEDTFVVRTKTCLWALTCAHEACASSISALPRSRTSSTAIEVSDRCFLIWRLREGRVWLCLIGGGTLCHRWRRLDNVSGQFTPHCDKRIVRTTYDRADPLESRLRQPSLTTVGLFLRKKELASNFFY